MLQRILRVGALSLAVIGLLAFSVSNISIAQGSGSGTITILHTQEHHGQVEPARPFGGNDLGGLEARGTVIEAIRAEVGADNAILVDTGDIMIGTPISSIFRGEPTILAYNHMGYDALAIGNHMFDFEAGENRFQILSDLADFPLMAANVSGLNFDADPGFVKLNRGGLIVLIIGLTNVETPSISNPTPGTVFSDPIETAQNVIAAEGGDADLIIAITHEDTFRDVDLLQSVPEIDVVIGGHTFGFEGIVTRGTFASIDDVPDGVSDQPNSFDNPDGVYVRAGGGDFRGRLGTSLGQLELVVENGVVVSATATNNVILPDTEHNRRDEEGAPNPDDLVALDADVTAIIEPFLTELDARLSEVIGNAAVNLDGERADVRSRETNLGNLIADVWRITQETDIGLQNGGGIRNSIPAGPITRANVLSVQPFGNTVVRFEITGEQLLAAMENGVSRVEDGSGRFPQISGMTLQFDSNAESGSRVIEITVGGAPLDPNRVYSVATNSFVGAGGDGYTMFRESTNFRDTQFVDADVVTEFILNTEGDINPAVDGRIVDVSAE